MSYYTSENVFAGNAVQQESKKPKKTQSEGDQY